jgi:hypothetical protein
MAAVGECAYQGGRAGHGGAVCGNWGSSRGAGVSLINWCNPQAPLVEIKVMR